jgi:hypothetical protein
MGLPGSHSRTLYGHFKQGLGRAVLPCAGRLPFRAGGVSLTLFVCDLNQRLESFGYIVPHQFLETVGLMRLQWKSVESVSSEVVRVHATYRLESCDGYYQCSDNHTEDFVTILYRHSRHLAPTEKIYHGRVPSPSHQDERRADFRVLSDCSQTEQRSEWSAHLLVKNWVTLPIGAVFAY